MLYCVNYSCLCRDRKESWRSGPVVKRESAKVLLTKSGSVYQLVGDLLVKKLSEPLSTALGTKFRKGFPLKWHSVIIKALIWLV